MTTEDKEKPNLMALVLAWPGGDYGFYRLYRAKGGTWWFEGKGKLTEVTAQTVREWMERKGYTHLKKKYFDAP